MKAIREISKLTIICYLLAGTASGQITLYDGELSQDVTTNSGASSFNYDSGVTAYGLHGYNGSNVTYVEEAAGTTFAGFGSGTILKVTNDLSGQVGGVDGFLRYNFAQPRVADFVNGTGTPSPFAVDIDNNPILEFDVIWGGDGTFGRVIVGPNTNASGAPTTDWLIQDLTANTITSVSVDLSSIPDYTNYLNAVAADASTGFAHFRIEVQSGTGTAGTFGIDNIRLVPEPSSASLVFIAGSALYFLRRRK